MIIMAGLTWRHWGNSIYIYEVQADKEGQPVGYKKPAPEPLVHGFSIQKQ